VRRKEITISSEKETSPLKDTRERVADSYAAEKKGRKRRGGGKHSPIYDGGGAFFFNLKGIDGGSMSKRREEKRPFSLI